ncbi:MAG TPA: hypothetical protein VLC92_09590 [Rhodocyclaceae bacterium]|nr:hypothetical protein [Rhodocyclaceae bacterium]
MFGIIDEEFRQRLLVLNNLADFTEADHANRRAQADGALLVGSSKIANLVDMLCMTYGFRLAGLAPDDEASSMFDSEVKFASDTVDWLSPGDDRFAVRLKISAPAVLLVVAQTGGGREVEHVLGRIRDLADVLGDRVEATRRAA